MDLFSTAALMTVIESRDRPTAFIRDTFFPNGFQSDAEEIAFDKLKRRRNVAPFVSPLLPGKERAIRGRQTSTFTPAYVKPKNTLRPVRVSVVVRANRSMATSRQKSAICRP